MNKELMDRVMEATRLTQSGRLQEATALLQGVLAPGSDTARPAAFKAASDVIDGECTEVGVEDAQQGSDEEGARVGAPDELPAFLRRFMNRKAPANGSAARGVDLAGKVVSGSYANAAGERAYRLYIPSRYTAGQALPLIVMLHGCKQTPDDFAAGTRMNELGEEHGCFVLYPEQSSAANAGGCWNWFRKEDQVRGKGEPSILAGMVGQVMTRYSIVAGRVYAAAIAPPADRPAA